jgi:hypothetical protein
MNEEDRTRKQLLFRVGWPRRARAGRDEGCSGDGGASTAAVALVGGSRPRGAARLSLCAAPFLANDEPNHTKRSFVFFFI